MRNYKVDPRKTMTKKAFKAMQKAQRNFWTCARPEGSRLSNRKIYSRKHSPIPEYE